MEAKVNPQVDSAEEWYNQKDSSYLRIQFEENKGYKITVRSECLIDRDEEEEIDNNILAMCTLMRGVAEIIINNADDIYLVGLECQSMDAENGTLMSMPVKGTA